MVILRVYSFEELLYLDIYILFEAIESTFTNLVHIFDQTLELVFIEDSNTFTVDSLELSREFTQKVLVLIELEVEDNV